jgi:hypothetical protein
MNMTVPKIIYKTPNPDMGEHYCVFTEILPSANHPTKRWVVKETHGYFENEAKKASNKATTLSPSDVERCVSLYEAFVLIENQVLSRAREGFKYLYELDPYSGKPSMAKLP